MYTHTVIPSIHVPCIFYYSVLWPPNAQLFHKLSHSYMFRRGPGSVVGTATGYGLDGPGIKSPWGARFSASVQTGTGAHPASCTMGTGSFPGVKSGQGVTLTPHSLLVPWLRKSRAIPLLPLWAVRACTEPQCMYKGALLHVSTLSCHPQGACNQYFDKLRKYFKCSCW